MPTSIPNEISKRYFVFIYPSELRPRIMGDAIVTLSYAFSIGQLLKGTKPGDLPIEQPMTFELVLNLKIGKAHRINFPKEIVVRAHRGYPVMQHERSRRPAASRIRRG